MKYALKSVKILFLFFLFVSNLAAQERYVRPVDEGAKDASFKEFREKLVVAVKNRDKKFVLGILDPNVKLSFGGDGGIADFKKMWKIDSPRSKFWAEFSAIITNGGTFYDEKTFAAPYSFTSFPDDLDAFQYSVIFGDKVNLRAKPALSAEVISQLSYNVVKVDYENSIKIKNQENEYSWLKIQTLGSQTGFVSAEFVRSPIDYRAIFVKENGKWMLSAFIAGD